MKKLTKTALAATLAAFMLLTMLPVSLAAKALAPKPAWTVPDYRSDANADPGEAEHYEAESSKDGHYCTLYSHEIIPFWTVPEGYNEHDYNKCVAFLEQTDENGVKNGTKLSEDYDPNDPETWGSTWFENTSAGQSELLDFDAADADALAPEPLNTPAVSPGPPMPPIDPNFRWRNVNNEFRIYWVNVSNAQFVGRMDVSGCTALTELRFSLNQLTTLDVSGCTALTGLYCGGNRLTELDVTQNTALRELYCYGNRLTELDVTQNTALRELYCYGNRLTELDVSQNTELTKLSCWGNQLTELDLRSANAWGHQHANPFVNPVNTEAPTSEAPLPEFAIPFGLIRAEGSGYIGCEEDWVYACPGILTSFEGFFSEDDVLLSEGQWSEARQSYRYRPLSNTSKVNIIARFSDQVPGAPGSGDINGDGATTADDAIIVLRAALGLVTLPEAQLAAGDMNGDGVIDVSDAILVLRAAMGL